MPAQQHKIRPLRADFVLLWPTRAVGLITRAIKQPTGLFGLTSFRASEPFPKAKSLSFGQAFCFWSG